MSNILAANHPPPSGLQADCLQPLSEIRPGSLVRIKRLTAPPEVAQRLRELGFCEEQCVRLLRQNGHLICQISQVRMGLSHRVAKAIWVVPAPAFNLPG